MASALQGTAVSTVRKRKMKSNLAQSQIIASDITTTDTSSASSVMDTISEMRRQLLEKTNLLMKHLINSNLTNKPQK